MSELRYFNDDPSRGALKGSFPRGCAFFATWAEVPEGWHTKSQLKKMKIKLPDNAQPVGGKRAMNGYYPLYDIKDLT